MKIIYLSNWVKKNPFQFAQKKGGLFRSRVLSVINSCVLIIVVQTANENAQIEFKCFATRQTLSCQH